MASKREQFIGPGRRPRTSTSINAMLVIAGLVLVAAVLFATRSQPGGGDAVERLESTGGDITLPLADFADGQARFYKYLSATGKEIRFFVLRSADGVTRAAFDTCDTCYRERRGYRQEGAQMICNNCEQAFHSNQINEVKGGCNPAPLDRVIQGDRIVLRAAALEQGAFYF